MKLWQSNKYILFFGYRFYYKQFFLQKIAKPLKLKCYREWKFKKNRKKRKFGRTLRNSQHKKRLLSKYQNYCGICKLPFKENDEINIDHIIPLSKADKKMRHQLNNLQLAHKKCNILKGNKI